MSDFIIARNIGLLAGAIFFIDGWGPSEKGVPFFKSRRFRGLSIIISGSIITPVLDYLFKEEKPLFFLNYLKGCVLGWFIVFLLCLALYIIWKETKNLMKGKVFWIGELAYAILDFIYLGISDNPHLNTKREHDIDRDKVHSESELEKLRKELDKNKTITPSTQNFDDATKKKLEEYEEKLKNIKLENDYSYSDWYYKGVAEFDKKEYEKTIAYMKNAIEKKPSIEDYAYALSYIGSAYFYLSLFEKYLEASVRVTELIPNDTLGWINKGIALNNLEQSNEAFECFTKAKKINPDDAYIWYNEAVTYTLKNKKPEAIADLRKAIELDKSFKEIAKEEEIFINNLQQEAAFKELFT